MEDGDHAKLLRGLEREEGKVTALSTASVVVHVTVTVDALRLATYRPSGLRRHRGATEIEFRQQICLEEFS